MKIGLSCKTFATEETNRLPKGRLTEEESIELLEYAYANGIRIFDATHEIKESEDYIGKWLNKYPHKDVLIGTKISIEKSPNIEKFLDISLNRLGRAADYFHLTNLKNVDDVPKALEILRELFKTEKIKRYGIRTHSIPVAKKIALSNLSSIQIPINPIEHGFYNRCRNLYRESSTTVIATKVFGGGMYIDYMRASFFFKMVLSFLEPNDILLVGVKSIKELNSNLIIFNEYDGEHYPIIETYCNDCQKCDEQCLNINTYPLSKWIRYCRYMDSKDEHYKKWGTQKLIAENIEMNCIQCKRCEEACPLNLKIKDFINNHISNSRSKSS